MSRIRQIIAAGGTFSVALGIGFVMQNGDALAARFSDPAPAEGPALSQPLPEQAAAVVDAVPTPAPLPDPALATVTVTPGDAAGALLGMADLIGTTSSTLGRVTGPLLAGLGAVTDMTGIRRDVPGGMALPTLPEDPVQLAALGPEIPLEAPVAPAASGCLADMTARAMPAAMVALSISAPCSPGQLITVHHQGMIFSDVTDSAGQLEVIVPALAAEAVFLADLGNGDGAVAVTNVPDFAAYDRAVLQWQGEAGFQIHALEFGAAYGDAGHVWRAAARDPQSAIAGTGGFIHQLGAGPAETAFRAEVYTFPSGQSSTDGVVRLSVEAEVTDRNCGREIAAQSIQLSPGFEARALDLVMTMPECSAVGEFLVLSNMLEDLTLAAR